MFDGHMAEVASQCVCVRSLVIEAKNAVAGLGIWNALKLDGLVIHMESSA